MDKLCFKKLKRFDKVRNTLLSMSAHWLNAETSSASYYHRRQRDAKLNPGLMREQNRLLRHIQPVKRIAQHMLDNRLAEKKVLREYQGSHFIRHVTADEWNQARCEVLGGDLLGYIKWSSLDRAYTRMARQHFKKLGCRT